MLFVDIGSRFNSGTGMIVGWLDKGGTLGNGGGLILSLALYISSEAVYEDVCELHCEHESELLDSGMYF